MKILLSSIYPYAFALLFLIVPFDDYVRAIPNILLIILAVGFPFVVSKSDFLKLKNPAFILFTCLIGYLLLNSLFLGRMENNFEVIKKILLAAGIIVLAIPLNNDKDKIYTTIIFSSLAAMAVCTYRIVLLVNETGTFDFGNSQNAIDALITDRLYLGLLCVLSILISFKSLSKKYSPYNNYYLANIVLNSLFVFLIVSRIAIIILFVLVIVYQFYGQNKAKRIIISLVVLSLLGSMAFIFNSNLNKRFFYSTEHNAHQNIVQKTMAWEPRTVIWACAAKIAQAENVFFEGLGFDSVRQKLVDCYDTDIKNPGRRKWFLERRYNSHNQFIGFYLSTGILSVFLFIAIFVMIFIKNRKSFFPTALLIAILLFGIIESYFYRQMGAYYFAIVMVLLLFESNVLSEKTNSKKELK